MVGIHRLRHASSVRSTFKRLLASTLAASVCVGLPLLACDGSSDSTEGSCRAAGTPDAGSCSDFRLALEGDPSTCGFGANGQGSTEFCRSVCGASVSCSREENGDVLCRASCSVDGRRHAFLEDDVAPRAVDAGSYLARMSFFEAASIDAF